MTPEVLAKITNGLSRVQIADCLRQARHAGRKVDHPLVSRWKKQSIEAELGELVEFVEPKAGLEALGGMARQKEVLMGIAQAMRAGRSEVVPKGIMLLGPPGCGKTFSMTCFARDCGIPFLTLKNIFSRYVGATESNLEKLFHYLEALSPVLLFVDEFDQSFGRRIGSDSDSGVSRRVFAMFNSFLSDDAHQGQILFGAATNRPDLLDASTIRAGRFDLKLPYFLPDDATRREVFEVTFRTLGVKQTVGSLDTAVAKTEDYSGADLREIVIIARRHAAVAGRTEIQQEDLDYAVADYIPPGKADPDTVRYMELLAVALTTSRALLTEEHTELVDSGRLQTEIDVLRTRIQLRG
jgi:ATP-dependent 26S proteasome regulatory subunit